MACYSNSNQSHNDRTFVVHQDVRFTIKIFFLALIFITRTLLAFSGQHKVYTIGQVCELHDKTHEAVPLGEGALINESDPPKSDDNDQDEEALTEGQDTDFFFSQGTSCIKQIQRAFPAYWQSLYILFRNLRI